MDGMATEVYKTASITLIDGTRVFLSPLKIKYLRQFMEIFSMLDDVESDDDSLVVLSQCAAIAMQQYYPKLSSVVELEDNVDLESIYKILESAADIKISKNSEKTVKDQASEESSWKNLDLAKLEAEAFMLGIWKDYDELESSLSMPELMATLEFKREADYQEKKFLAAMQGVDLDKQTGKKNDDAWEKLKAKVFSKGQAANSDDILSLQGVNAQKAGFGIGMGLEYERIE